MRNRLLPALVACFVVLSCATASSAQTVRLSATGLAFGNVALNNTSTKTLTISNKGTANLVISDIATTNGSFGWANCSGATITPNSSCTVNVTFTPTVTGSASGTLSITDNASNSPQSVTLSGTGVQPVTVTPASLTFASQVVGTTSAAKSVTLTNYQSIALNVSSVSATASFSASACPAQVAPAGNCVINVTFTPTTTGKITGKLTITDDAGAQTVTLQGTGAQSQGPTLVSITVTPAGPSIPAGTTQPFAATGNYSDGSQSNITNSVSWGSSATGVATVNGSGVATAILAGSTTISAISGSITGSTLLTVTAPVLVSISVTPPNPSIIVNGNQQFTATGTYNNGTNANLTASVSWASSNLSAATISASGLATGVAAGSTSISATSGSVVGSTNLTVTTPLVSIAVTPATPSLAQGQTQQFTATGNYSDGSMQNLTQTVTWSTSNASVATVSSTGLATAAGQGTATISAVYQGITGTDLVTVTPPVLISISVTPASPTLGFNVAQQFTATGTFSDNSTQNLTSTGVTWSAGGVQGGNSTVGTISSTGLYTAPASAPTPPQVTITATSGANQSISGSTTATVSQLSVTVSPLTAQVEATQTQPFTATVTGTTDTSVTWSVGGVAGGNTTLGTISTTGLYTAPSTVPSPAQVTVTATSAADGVTNSSATVTVVPLIQVSVVPSTLQYVDANATKQFTAVVTGTSNTAVTWSVGSVAGGNSIVGTISSSGLYTAPPIPPNPEQVYITATSVADPTKSANGLVSAVSPAGVSVTVSPTSAWLQAGKSTQCTARLGGTQNTGVTWAVDGIVGGNSTIGTISTSGLYIAPNIVPSPAQVTVTATSAAKNTAIGYATLTIGATPFSALPLVDFTPGQLYLGQFQGMLYNGSNSPSADQLAAGTAAGALVQPLDADGNPDPNGKIVFISMGVSEASDEWCEGQASCTSNSFVGQAKANASVNHSNLVILNGATSGANTTTWSCAYGTCPLGLEGVANQYDRVRDNVLTPAGVTEKQVQAVWVETVTPGPTWFPSLPSTSSPAYAYEYDLGYMLRTIRQRWPNVQQVFIGTRIYAGYATTFENPEPYAYEYGYGVKWLINAQILQRDSGTIDPLGGDLLTNVPWVDWAAYLWGNDSMNIPGSLALNWPPSLFEPDGTHPDPSGTTQVGATLLNFFLNSPVTPWFRN